MKDVYQKIKIMAKLRDKHDWISEFTKIKKAIPRNWKNILKTEPSVKTKVTINKDKLNFGDKHDLFSIKNEEIYKIILNMNETDTPVGFITWEKIFSEGKLYTQIQNTLKFTFTFLKINKLKTFKWKLLHFILPCKEMLHRWKISDSNLCSFCQAKEDYKHFFISCSYNKTYWMKINKLLKYLQIGEHVLSLKSLVLGYKINDRNYYELNLLLTLIYFSIYKAYYVSNQKENVIDIFNIFKKEVEEINDIHNFFEVEQ